MSWYKVELSNDQVISGKIDEIQEIFDKAYQIIGSPKGFALFGGDNKNEEDRTKVIEKLYFSSDSIEYLKSVIEAHDGDKCEKPAKDEVGLLLGQNEDWELLD